MPLLFLRAAKHYHLHIPELIADMLPMSVAKKLKVRTNEKIKVIIADDDGQTSRRTQDFLTQHGFECRMAQNGSELKKLLAVWTPRILIVDLLLPESNALEVLKFINEDQFLKSKGISVLVMSGHSSQENVRSAYEAGAKDYLARPIMYQDLLNRIVFHCREQREIEPIKEKATTESIQMASLVVDQILQEGLFEHVLFSLTKLTAAKLQAERCSVIHHITQEKGIVLASNDKKEIAGLPLDLMKYPEIQLVVNTGRPIVIDNLNDSKALKKIKSHLKDISFNAMIVCPISFRGKIYGAISVRLPDPRGKLKPSDIYFVEYVAKTLSLYISSQDPSVLGKYGLISA